MLAYHLRSLNIVSQLQLSMASRDKKIQHITKKGSNISKQPQKHSKKQQKHRSPRPIYTQNGLFGSNRLVSNSKKESRGREVEGVKNSQKVITTDESNNCFESKIHESIFYCENKQPNEQYFQSIPLKDKRKKQDSASSSRKSSKLKDLSCKLKEMQKIVVQQNRELATMKGVISQKELHRLIKIQSIERLKAISTVKSRISSKRKNKL